MRCYCVPGCSSSCRRKQLGLSFPEVPADISLREKWLHAILRDVFPSTAIKKRSVCSRHFLTTDFKKDFTRRLLKPGAVPSVIGELVPSLARIVESTTAGQCVREHDSANCTRRTGSVPSTTRKHNGKYVRKHTSGNCVHDSRHNAKA
ncbi:hypothetical protein HPB49_009694 [Dermacentor silvarum]|uniref:Uncharacterized protein n=1 Tax=Dermacentor silvarum TaxID=543639 RepID=A0ACB8CE53_DERSI|nr:hypothetical protein HPB49_009694 [Dermacentor silvarum]